MSDIPTVKIIQSVAILIDGNNIERSLHSMTKDDNCMINFDNLIPKLLKGRGLSRLIYFREGNQISSKLADRLLNNYMGSVVPCHKSADIPLSISATQIARKVDTIIILSGDSDYVELVRHLKGEGVRIEIAAVKATTAQILIDESDHFIEINEEDSFSLAPKRGNVSNKRTSAKSRSNNHKSSPSKAPNSKTTKKEIKSAVKKNDVTKSNTKKKVKPNASNKSAKTEKQEDSNQSKKPRNPKNTKPKSSQSPSSTSKTSTPKAKKVTKSNSKQTKPVNTKKKAAPQKRNSPKSKKTNARKKTASSTESIDDFSY